MNHITDETFTTDVLGSNKVVLVDFWATWCGPCQILGPIIEQVADEIDQSKFFVGKVNVDENPEVTQKYSIMSIPTIIFFKNGKEVERLVGVHQKKEIIEVLQKHEA